MWNYYGSKSKIVGLYPPAGNKKIIEPFAGTGRYALRFWKHDVLLVDRYPEIIEIWKWLQNCSDQELERMPHFVAPGDKITDFNFDSRAAKLLFSFIIGYATATPRVTVSRQKALMRPNFINYTLKKIQHDRHKIKHWDIVCDDYRNINNQVATWFVDPPYQVAGYKYKFWKIDYQELSGWVLSRKGEVIVCEGAGADWLPFKELKNMHGARGFSMELFFHSVDLPGEIFYPSQGRLF